MAEELLAIEVAILDRGSLIAGGCVTLPVTSSEPSLDHASVVCASVIDLLLLVVVALPLGERRHDRRRREWLAGEADADRDDALLAPAPRAAVTVARVLAAFADDVYSMRSCGAVAASGSRLHRERGAAAVRRRAVALALVLEVIPTVVETERELERRA